MKLTYINAIECLGALSALDGTPKVIVDGGRETVVSVPMTFTPNVRIAIAKNICALRMEKDAFEQRRTEIARQLANGGAAVAPENMGEYVVAMNALSQTETSELPVTCFTESDLNLSQNPIPPSVLASLMPFIASSSGAMALVKAAQQG